MTKSFIKVEFVGVISYEGNSNAPNTFHLNKSLGTSNQMFKLKTLVSITNCSTVNYTDDTTL